MNLKIILLAVCLSCASIGKGQANDWEAAIYNVSLGSLFGGVGALINKNPGELWHKVLFKGMWQGAAGGYVVFESKRMLRNIHKEEKLEYAWGANLLNAAGSSMIENAASNRDLWEQWNLPIGFIRMEFHTKNEFKFRPKIMPIAFGYTVYNVVQSKFEAEKSIKTGHLIFSNDSPDYFENDFFTADAFWTPGGIVLNAQYKDFFDDLWYYEIISHEIVHAYQWNEFNAVNAFHLPLRNYLNQRSQIFNRLDQWIYWDMQGSVKDLLYQMENNIDRKCYYDNFIEHEAGYFSNTLYSCD